MIPELRPLSMLRRAMAMPPAAVLDGARRLALLLGHQARQRLRDLWATEDLGRGAVGPDLRFPSDAVLPVVWPETAPTPDVGGLKGILREARNALDHRFDLLGSGPVRVDYEMEAPGLSGHRYSMAPGRRAADAQRARMARLLPSSLRYGDYDPVDWHVDFRSGFRWSPSTWFSSIRYGHRAGVDVKLPWELSRFQHVGALGLAARLAPHSPEGRAAGHEFVRQVVDWMAANPVRRGVNWAMAMDVALRAVNWLVGVALMPEVLRDHPGFESLLVRSLAQHGRHIEANLEHHPSRAGNHYTSNLLGLVALGAALPQLPESDRWLVFGLQELESESGHQVLPDGVDVEGSTTYHAFVAEMFTIAAAIVTRLPDARRQRLRTVEPGPVAHPLAPEVRPLAEQDFDLDLPCLLSRPFLERVRDAGRFIGDLTKASGLIPQIGDQDNGRVLRLGSAPDPRDWRTLPAVVGRMFGDAAMEGEGRTHTGHARLLVPERGRLSDCVGAENPRVVRHSHGTASLALFPSSRFAVGRADRLFLAVHAGLLTERSPTGHFHNDLLGFELAWGETDIIVDPGCLVYTPLPDLRDAYRSTGAHSTVAVSEVEQRLWPPRREGLFVLAGDADAASLEAGGASSLRGFCAYGPVRHHREWRWDEGRLEVDDLLEAPAPATSTLNLAPGVLMDGEPTEAGGLWTLRLRSAAGPMLIRWRGVAQPVVGPGLYAAGYGRPVDCLRITAGIRDPKSHLIIEREE